AAKVSIPSLVATARQDASPAVRARAADALGQLGVSSPDVQNALVTTAGDKDAAVVQAALRSLAELGADASVTTPLLEKLMHDQRPGVAADALAALAAQGDLALPILERALAD